MYMYVYIYVYIYIYIYICRKVFLKSQTNLKMWIKQHYVGNFALLNKFFGQMSHNTYCAPCACCYYTF